MQGLIQKSGYMKSGSGADSYMKYIATRDGVELPILDGPATRSQQQLVFDLLRDFPDADALPEFSDYEQAQTAANASAFISAVLDENAHTLQESDCYMRYIAERPRSHGLFSDADNVDLERTMAEVSAHPGPVWTLIYSLKREDAERLCYNSADSWRRLILSHQAEMAEAMKISPKEFRWCAAYHDEGHHPHIHMMVWSADPKQGYLTEQGIEKMRSKLTNHIFKDELLSLYQEKDISYKELTETVHDTMTQLIRQMQSSICDSPVIADKMETLSQMLSESSGKKVYRYLKKPAKEVVDAIVDELAKQPEVAECYDIWNSLRDELERYYKDKPREHLPLSRQKEFRSIKNMVIHEAEQIRLGTATFEDQRMADEVDEELDADNFFHDTLWRMADQYQDAKAVLYDWDAPEDEKEECVRELEQLWENGFTVAAHQLGKCWRDGLGVLPDDDKAEWWFRRSAEAGNDFSQYVLGKLLESRKQIAEAAKWYEEASARGNQYADYRLGKLYLQGEVVPKDVGKAVEHLTRSAQQENQYAQYALGKLYLTGRDVPRDLEQAYDWLSAAAWQGNQYAEFLLDRMEQDHTPDILLSATRLLHHMGQIFRENSVPPRAPAGIHIDRKRWEEIIERRLASGQALDDHENPEMNQVNNMGGMSM